MSAWMQAATLLLLASGLYAAGDDLIAFFPKELRQGAFPVTARLLDLASRSGPNPSCLVRILNGKQLAWSDAQVGLDFVQMDAYGMIEVPPNLSTSADYKLSISCSNVNMSTLTKSLKVGLTTPGLFIQTDKYKYKAGDLVMFRAIAVTEGLLPQTGGNLEVSLKDPKGNLVYKKGPTDAAMLQGEFQLSEDPILGLWILKVNTEEGDKTANFEVAKYVLPRFEVTVNAKQIGQSLEITAEAKYTYGKRVQGTLFVTVNKEKVVIDYEYGDAPAIFIFHFFELKLTTQGSTNVNVFAKVFEDFTETQMNATKKIDVLVSDVSFGCSVEQPAPLISSKQTTYQFQVRITDTYGEGPPQEGEIGDYRVNWQTSSKVSGFVIVDVNPINVTIDLMKDGRRISIYSIKVWITRGREESVHVTFRPEEYKSMSGESITLQKVSSTNQNEACYQIPEYNGEVPAFCQVITDTATQLQPYSQATGHCFHVTPAHKPSCMVICYMIVSVKDKKDLLVANQLYDFQWDQPNQVTTTISPSVVRPGDDVQIAIRTRGLSGAGSRSWVGISGVDASTKIQADGMGNEITPSQLQKFAGNKALFYSPEPQYPNRPMPFGGRMIADCFDCGGYRQPGVYPGDLLKEAGMTFLSNKVEVQQQFDIYHDDIMIVRNKLGGVAPPEAMRPEMAANDLAGGAVANKEEETGASDEEAGGAATEPRTDFPETWLFNMEETDENGDLMLDTKVPDTITNFTVEAVALSETNGIGVAEPAAVTVFKDFFVDMILPYSVVRTEGFELEILVFNYLVEDIEVTVTFVTTESIRVEDPSKAETVVTIGGGATAIVQIPVTAVEIGKVPLTVDATAIVTNTNRIIPRDSVVEELLVKAEGRELVVYKEVRLDVVTVNGEVDFNLTTLFTAYSPYTFVRGSLRMNLMVTGDLMGSFIAGLGSKVRMPSGCGEQNLISFTPSLFIMKYLIAVGEVDPSLRKLATKVCLTGYSRQLIYMHGNFSFSAFGDTPCACPGRRSSGTPGSTWLTAYVLRIFSELYQLDLTPVDVTLLHKIFNFLKEMITTNSDSMFSEYGRVIHTSMMGGASSGSSFTAFTLIAVMKYREVLTILRAQNMPDVAAEMTVDDLIATGTRWLRLKERELVGTQDAYMFSISGYALALGVTEMSDDNYNTAKTYMEEYESIMNTQPPAIRQCPGLSFGLRPACFEKQSVVPTCRNDDDCTADEPLCCDMPCAVGKTCTKGVLPSTTDGSSKIEMHGYALLAYTALYEASTSAADRDLFREKAILARNFLVDQRKNGFFKSTQDTAIALQALSVFAMTFPETRSPDFTVQATSAGTMVTDQITVNRTNAMLLTTKKIDVSADEKPRDLGLVIGGTSGTAYATVQAIYNVMDNSSSRTLNIEVKTKKNQRGYEINPCFWANPDKPPSSMVLMQIEMASGMAYDGVKAENVQKVEFDKNSQVLNLYYQDDLEDNFSARKCAKISTTVDVEITNIQPAKAMALNYYDTDDNAETSYSIMDSDVPTIGAMGLMINVLLLALSSVMARLVVTM